MMFSMPNQKKLSNERDWYAILQIERLADEAAIIKPKTFWTCMLNCQHCKTKYGYGVLLANRTIYAVNTVGSHVKLAFLRCAAGVGACCEGEESKDGYVPASRDDIESQSSTNVASKRVRQSTPDSGEILKARNGEEMNDANV
ncbi:hypothetical protein JHK82_056467 [Glycine max]|nr:hypothetical protein JHK86_056300 [Glycine max]KAG4919026.1 hypothetical protein JHK85_057307 [Glycine max]KAG5075110.1 hypothetical protein JHK84_056341 [Glycine max]KAG5077772.1 hypothetical protein JHK82_056467 [Glycine max]